jgi:general secretion pathway protein G
LLLIGIIAAVLLDRLAYTEELAEKTAMESMLQQLQSGLRIKAAELMIGMRYDELARLDRVDPFALLEGGPGSSAGEDGRGGSAFRPGSWRYDGAAGEVQYVPSARRHLLVSGGAGKDGALRFRSRLVRSGPGGGIVTVVLEPVTRYRWFD